MNRFDRLSIGDTCPRHSDCRVISKDAATGVVECAPNAQPLEYVHVAKTAQPHDLAKYADDPEAAADLELAIEGALA